MSQPRLPLALQHRLGRMTRVPEHYRPLEAEGCLGEVERKGCAGCRLVLLVGVQVLHGAARLLLVEDDLVEEDDLRDGDVLRQDDGLEGVDPGDGVERPTERLASRRLLASIRASLHTM